MPLLRTLTTKIKTVISPSASPTSSAESSPTSPQVSSFEVVNGRKEGAMAIKRPETYPRSDSFMTDASNASRENVDYAEKKHRMSRFREELDVGYE
ncbi:uncharacterized protein K460DRAFT_368927 [Cucurbitaria berberidis CBS 394.84]|uniref:Uncharacterized protein n=1 Tax=Cucurbitaria berberidis CBS 394.84 TaxID=1168544 RepID=A0A9P4L7F6_9PLEO|nr:uncharacterized protein K460DRAFT_368927 [Cucurbitaria berberidis CBS 394.84]KAF1844058.1 hypothetical protein K460DRAFT_368927 [Cucurbitaria berberidis CBS 394.84]